MHQLALTQWTHDIRNALSTVALYVDTLDHPGNPQSSKTVACTQALLGRVAAMCSGAARQAREGQPLITRARFDVVQTITQVRELIAPTLPIGVAFEVETEGSIFVLADAQDLFRILFNLLHNAATVARQTRTLSTIEVTVERKEAMAVITVSDDGPGLPQPVRSQLFLGGRSLTGGSGHGLAIARELAERNGGTLRTADVPRGATFLVEVPLDAASADRVATLFRGREYRSASGLALGPCSSSRESAPRP